MKVAEMTVTFTATQQPTRELVEQENLISKES